MNPCALQHLPAADIRRLCPRVPAALRDLDHQLARRLVQRHFGDQPGAMTAALRRLHQARTPNRCDLDRVTGLVGQLCELIGPSVFDEIEA